MKKQLGIIIATGLLATSFGFLASAANAGVLLDENFDGMNAGELPGSGPVHQWRGPENGLFGFIEVTSEKASGEQGKSIRFCDNSAKPNGSPILTAEWKTPVAGSLTVEWKVMVPVSEPYISLQFIGSNWDDAPVIVIFENGKIAVDFADGKRTDLGPYENSKWYVIKAELRQADKTFDLYLDGKQVIKSYAWRSIKKVNLSNLSIGADFSAADRAGAPVLYIDDLKVSVTP